MYTGDPYLYKLPGILILLHSPVETLLSIVRQHLCLGRGGWVEEGGAGEAL